MADTYRPPADVARNAQMALDVRESKPASARGMTLVGLARARQLANREPVSLDTIQRMASYFARHAVDKQGSTWNDQGRGWQAWHGWGGDAGRDWVQSILKEYKQMEVKAGSRHSEADMKIIRTARKTAQDLVNHMVALGDDGMPNPSPMMGMVPSMPMKAVKATQSDLTMEVCKVLANTVFLQYKTHAAHWNVEGEDFPQYHEFFEQIYEALDDAIDGIAETLRALDYKAPATLFQLAMHQPIDKTTADDSLDSLIASISMDNLYIIDCINGGIMMAGELMQYGVQNFLQDRLMYHQKLRWQLRAVMMAEPHEMQEMAETPMQESAEPVDMQMYEYEPDPMMAIRAAADRNATPKEREAMPADDFVLPDTRNFPIVTPDDVSAAVSTWGRYKGDATFEEFKAKLIALAKRKGPDFVTALPQAWRDEMTKSVQDFARKLLGMNQ